MNNSELAKRKFLANMKNYMWTYCCTVGLKRNNGK